MKTFIFCLLPSLFLLSSARAGVVVTYRGDAPNAFGYGAAPTDVDFDVNNDGIQDYRFIGGYFVAGIESYGSNRFLSTLAIAPDLGGSVTAIQIGSIISINTSSSPGDWHHSSDNGGANMFDLNFGPMSLQVSDAYIGVEFAAADGIHYGWIQYVGYSHPEKGLGRNHPGGFIDSWAWESRPGVPIIAGAVPEPGVSVLFLAGSLWAMTRRNRQKVVQPQS